MREVEGEECLDGFAIICHYKTYIMGRLQRYTNVHSHTDMTMARSLDMALANRTVLTTRIALRGVPGALQLEREPAALS